MQVQNEAVVADREESGTPLLLRLPYSYHVCAALHLRGVTSRTSSKNPEHAYGPIFIRTDSITIPTGSRRNHRWCTWGFSRVLVRYSGSPQCPWGFPPYPRLPVAILAGACGVQRNTVGTIHDCRALGLVSSCPMGARGNSRGKPSDFQVDPVYSRFSRGMVYALKPL